ncbi:MAG: hypothetical protein GF317_07480 [Candidatus Lokiarchaeota archaeon]|nr:hypothetical protein [Candidatus Lokiarchaeota archaeon]MBD3199550.1 hypothetical protein [Candidatus Lokiarchaeota archaeon]
MGFSLKELTFKQRYLLYLTEQIYAGPWFSFKMHSKTVGTVPVILKNIEPTPIYKLVNSRKGRSIDRITLDFDIQEYLKQLMRDGKIKQVKFKKENPYIRLYIDIFSKPKVPYINTFFTFKNISDYTLLDFTIYFVFDFDINGLSGFDNDLSGYDEENDIIYQYDETNLHGGFSPISKSTHFESSLTKNFNISHDRLHLSNTLYDQPGEILSALQIDFKNLEPKQTFQTALTISGGFDKEELIDNIKKGKNSAIKYLDPVNRNVKSKHRNEQEKAFVKINEQKAEDCSKYSKK